MSNDKYGKVLGIVLAGGEGTRLMPLTKNRAKPAVQFAARYRIIDFVISNLINSGIYSIYVLVQHHEKFLKEYIEKGWKPQNISGDKNPFIKVISPQACGKKNFKGTADAVYQNLDLMSKVIHRQVCIFASDHIYKMDIRQMLNYHHEKNSRLTIASKAISLPEASQFGCMKTDEDGRIIDFEEKPEKPPPIPAKPDCSYISMGNYIFEKELLFSVLVEDSKNILSNHDFGHNLIPELVAKGQRVFAYDFSTNVISGYDKRTMKQESPYWKDVGTIKSYWQAHMEILDRKSKISLYNPKWPIMTNLSFHPPTYTYSFNQGNCEITSAMTCDGCQISEAKIKRSILSRNCTIHKGSTIEDCIIGENVTIGENCMLKKTIIASRRNIPDGTVAGYDIEEDKKRYFVDLESGIVVIGYSK